MKNFFEVNDEKLTEKAFMRSLTSSVITIILCLVVLCSVTYAWFTESTASNVNTLVSGSFDIEATVTYNKGLSSEMEIMSYSNENGIITYQFLDAGAYTVDLKITENSNVKGFCGISLGGGERLLTASISKDATIGSNSLTFTVNVGEGGAMLTLTPQWGYPANVDVHDLDQLSINSEGKLEVVETETESETETETEGEASVVENEG